MAAPVDPENFAGRGAGAYPLYRKGHCSPAPRRPRMPGKTVPLKKCNADSYRLFGKTLKNGFCFPIHQAWSSVESAPTLDTRMANVIHVGINPAVLATRKAILEKAGHSVTLARDLRELISACEGSSFDIGIIGQALPAMEKLRISDTLRNHCEGIRILEFHDAIKPDVQTADAHLRMADTTPASFLDTVTELARRRKKGKASE